MAQQPVPTAQAYRDWLEQQPASLTFQPFSDPNDQGSDYDPGVLVRPWLYSLGMSEQDAEAWLEPGLISDSDWVERTADFLPMGVRGIFTRDQVLCAFDDASADAPMDH